MFRSFQPSWGTIILVKIFPAKWEAAVQGVVIDRLPLNPGGLPGRKRSFLFVCSQKIAPCQGICDEEDALVQPEMQFVQGAS